MESIFNEDWTADVIGRMHKFRITNVQLAAECGYTPAYLSTVLNGRKTFESEDTKERTKSRILDALKRIEVTVSSENEGDSCDSTY